MSSFHDSDASSAPSLSQPVANGAAADASDAADSAISPPAAAAAASVLKGRKASASVVTSCLGDEDFAMDVVRNPQVFLPTFAAELTRSRESPGGSALRVLWSAPGEMASGAAHAVYVRLQYGEVLAPEVVLALLANNVPMDEHTVIQWEDSDGVLERVAADTVWRVRGGASGDAQQASLTIVLERGRVPEVWMSQIVGRYSQHEHSGRRSKEFDETVRPAFSQAQLANLRARMIGTHSRKRADSLCEFLAPYALPGWRSHRPGGVLMYGPPGTGKSVLCQMIVDELGLGAVVLHDRTAAEFNARYVGDSEKKLRLLQRRANANEDRLYVVILEEVHTLAKDQKSARGSSDYKQDSMVVLLDVMAATPNILFLATTNFKEQLDEAFLRSKRLTHHMLVPPMGAPERYNILLSKIRGMGPTILGAGRKIRDPKRVAEELTWLTPNFSWAQMDTFATRLRALHVTDFADPADSIGSDGDSTGTSSDEVPSSFQPPLGLMMKLRATLGGVELDADDWRVLHRMAGLLQTVATNGATRTWAEKVLAMLAAADVAGNEGRKRTEELLSSMFTERLKMERIVGDEAQRKRRRVEGRLFTGQLEMRFVPDDSKPSGSRPFALLFHCSGRDEHKSFLSYALDGSTDAHVRVALLAVRRALRLDGVVWVDERYCERHSDCFAQALREDVDRLRSTGGNGLVIIDYDAVSGRVRSSETFGDSASQQMGDSAAATVTGSVSSNVGAQASRGRSGSTTQSDTKGSQDTSESHSRSHQEAVNRKTGRTESTSTTVSLGSRSNSTSKSRGRTVGENASATLSHGGGYNMGASEAATRQRNRSAQRQRSVTYETHNREYVAAVDLLFDSTARHTDPSAPYVLRVVQRREDGFGISEEMGRLGWPELHRVGLDEDVGPAEQEDLVEHRARSVLQAVGAASSGARAMRLQLPTLPELNGDEEEDDDDPSASASAPVRRARGRKFRPLPSPW